MNSESVKPLLSAEEYFDQNKRRLGGTSGGEYLDEEDFLAYASQLQPSSPQLEQAVKRLQEENENLKTVMIAAAEEIKQHWEAHCDHEGCGPSNLLHRLENGIPAQYGYTAGAFFILSTRLLKLEQQLPQTDAVDFAEWVDAFFTQTDEDDDVQLYASYNHDGERYTMAELYEKYIGQRKSPTLEEGQKDPEQQ